MVGLWERGDTVEITNGEVYWIDSEEPIVLRIGIGKKPRSSKYQGKTLSDNLMVIWQLCWAHADGIVFREPVTDDVAPGYSSIIKKPMDLSTIKKKIEKDVRRSIWESYWVDIKYCCFWIEIQISG